MLALCMLGFVTSVVAELECCTGSQFEALLGDVGGMVFQGKSPQSPDGYSRMFYDYDAKKMRLETPIYQPDGNVQVTNIIIDFKTKKEYVISGSTCSVTSATGSMSQYCVPTSAMYVGSSTVGVLDKSFKVNTWRYKKTDTDNVVNRNVTEVGCIPIGEDSDSTRNGATTDAGYFITNFKPGIADRSVFNIPTNCVPAKTGTNKFVGRAVKAMKNLFE